MVKLTDMTLASPELRPDTKVYTPLYGYDSAAFVWPLPNGRSERMVMRTWYSPLWKIGVLTALLPALWLAARLGGRRRRAARARAGLCPSCGYDLRASPGRCPECGRVTGSPV